MDDEAFPVLVGRAFDGQAVDKNLYLYGSSLIWDSVGGSLLRWKMLDACMAG